jgi:hypothetical protein
VGGVLKGRRQSAKKHETPQERCFFRGTALSARLVVPSACVF